jgi:hypothetical protein
MVQSGVVGSLRDSAVQQVSKSASKAGGDVSICYKHASSTHQIENQGIKINTYFLRK